MPEIIPAETTPCLSRRGFLAAAAIGVVGLALEGPVSGRRWDEELPVSGEERPELAPFDRLMTRFVVDNRVPGASLAIARNGKLIFARGFGYADVENQESVQPDSLFRIASVSKPITAVAILQLVEKKRFDLDDRVMDLMKITPPPFASGKIDERWRKITVRQCLQHTGGWDRSKSYDPIVRARMIAKALGIKLPVQPTDVVQFMLGQPLDFDPGERYAYSNLGYLVLGRILEQETRRRYEEYVQKEVFAPLGVKKPRLGRALIKNRAKDEVRYYDREKRTGPALYPPRLGEQVPLQYGAENLEAFEAHGGWIASAVDLVKFAAAFDDPANCPILGPKAIEQAYDRPSGAAGHNAKGKPKAVFYGCGWQVRPVGKSGKANTWHTGFIAGTEAILVHRWDNLSWAVLFNTSNTPDNKSLAGLIDGRLHQAATEVKTWPTDDLFGKYLS